MVLDWLVTPEADGEFDEPRASLALVIDGAVERTVELGSFAGSFADGRELFSLRATGSLLMGIFWFAGSGDEIVVRRPEPTTLTVEKRGIDEQVEPGEFEVVETVEIPAGSEVTLAEWRDQ